MNTVSRQNPISTQARVVAWVCAVSAAMLLVAVVWVCRSWLMNQAVVTVTVSGNLLHSDKSALQALIKPYVGQGMLELDAAQLRQVLLKEAWVDDVAIRKQWPDQVLVDVVEQVPVAYWHASGFVNHRGELFFPADVPENMNLPYLYGEQIDGEQIFDIYQRLSSVLKPRDLSINSLYKNPLGVYTAVLQNETAIVFEAVNTMAQLSKLVTVYDSYLNDVSEYVARIDLRYTNGLAVAWRPAQRLADENTIKGINHES